MICKATWQSRRLCLVAALVVTLAIQGHIAFPDVAHASTYSCTPRHCYGTADWQRSSLWGAQTTLSSISGSLGGGDGFVSEEILMNEDPGPVGYYCNANGIPQGACWVEAGVPRQGVGGQPCANTPYYCYFWADLRPDPNNDYNNFYIHLVANVATTDYNHSAKFAIYSNPGGDTFTVQSITPSGTYYNFSSNNVMGPTDYQLGVELSGDSNYGAMWCPPRTSSIPTTAMMAPYGRPRR